MRQTRLCAALTIAFAGSVIANSAFAQQQLERVEITGSAIKRIDAETAVPVTILKVDDLKKEGVTTIEQILERVSAGQVSQSTSQAVGSATGGAAFANLRGLGQNKTLVLLNGRRLANNAIDSTAPDLNMIPFAALERVEVLRDGASALYGTDAVGGVINFITKRDFTGGSMTAGTDKPQLAAGKAYNANFAFGTGELEKDRFNLFGVLDYQKQDRIRASERPDINARSLKTSGSTYPGQYNQNGNTEDPLFPGCGAPNGTPTPNPKQAADKTCGYLYAREVDLIPNTERMSALFSGTLKINEDSRANLEYFVSRDRNDTLTAGVPYGALAVNPGTPFYPGNGITPLPTAFTLDPTFFPANSPDGRTARLHQAALARRGQRRTRRADDQHAAAVGGVDRRLAGRLGLQGRRRLQRQPPGRQPDRRLHRRHDRDAGDPRRHHQPVRAAERRPGPRCSHPQRPRARSSPAAARSIRSTCRPAANSATGSAPAVRRRSRSVRKRATRASGSSAIRRSINWSMPAPASTRRPTAKASATSRRSSPN